MAGVGSLASAQLTPDQINQLLQNAALSQTQDQQLMQNPAYQQGVSEGVIQPVSSANRSPALGLAALNPTAAAPGTAAATSQAPATVSAPAQRSSTTTSAAANPLQPTYLPNPPTATPTTYGASGYGATGYTNPYNAQTAVDELNSAAGVQDLQQNQNLMSMLAAQGISPGSSAAQASAQNLANTQTAALAPSLVGAQEYGAGLSESSGLANAGALNAAGQFNAGAANTAGAANAGAANTMTLQNLQDLLQSQQFNATAANTAGTTQAQLANNDWLAELQAQLGLQQTGLGTSGQLAGDQANQTVPINPSLFSQIAGAAATGASDYVTAGSGGAKASYGSY